MYSAWCGTLKSGGRERREQRTALLSSRRVTMGTYTLASRSPLPPAGNLRSGSEFRWGFHAAGKGEPASWR